jgi:hypothetical protein
VNADKVLMLVRALFYTRPRADFWEFVAPSDGAARRRAAELRVRYLTARLPEQLIGSDLVISTRLFCELFILLPGRMFGPGVTMYALLHFY